MIQRLLVRFSESLGMGGGGAELVAVTVPVSGCGSIRSWLSYSGYGHPSFWALTVAPGRRPRVAGGEWVDHQVQGATMKGGGWGAGSTGGPTGGSVPDELLGRSNLDSQ